MLGKKVTQSVRAKIFTSRKKVSPRESNGSDIQSTDTVNTVFKSAHDSTIINSTVKKYQKEFKNKKTTNVISHHINGLENQPSHSTSLSYQVMQPNEQVKDVPRSHIIIKVCIVFRHLTFVFRHFRFVFRHFRPYLLSCCITVTVLPLRVEI